MALFVIIEEEEKKIALKISMHFLLVEQRFAGHAFDAESSRSVYE